jgi:hypothetical protein
LLVIAVMGGLYAWYVTRNLTTEASRNLRLLATLTGQLQEAVSEGVPIDAVKTLGAQSYLSRFDLVLLAGTDGRVLHSQHPPRGTPLPAKSAARRGPEKGSVLSRSLVVTDLSAIEEQTGVREWSLLNVRRLRGGSRVTEVRVAGVEYYLYTQSLKRPGQDVEYVVAGLVSRRTVRLDAFAISGSLLGLSLALLVIGFCCLPFLRIVLIGSRKALRPSDVVLASLGAVLGGAVLTVTFADVFVLRRLAMREDHQLKVYAEQLVKDIEQDFSRAAAMTTALRDAAGDRTDIPWSHDAVFQYPYFSSRGWLPLSAESSDRWVSTGDYAQPRPSTAEALLSALREKRLWMTVVNGRTYSFALQTESSLVNGEPHVFVAVPEGGDKPSRMYAAKVPLIHVMHPVVPAGFGFAVVDDQNGEVLFHSEASRAGHENFFRETDDNRLLRAAVYARRAAFVEARYSGADHIIRTHPLPTAPWTVMAFRDESLLRATNSEAIAFTALFLTFYAAVFAIGFVVLAIVKPDYRAPWLWPNGAMVRRYQRLVAALILEMAAFAACIYFCFPGVLLTVGIVAPLRAAAVAYLTLRESPVWRKPVLPVIAASLTVAWIWAVCVGDPDIRLSAIENFEGAKFLIAVMIAVPFGLGLSRPGGGESATSHAATASFFVLNGILLLFLTSVFPALAFFKAATRFEVETRVKYSQLTLAHDFERRLNHLERINVRPQRIAFDSYKQKHIFNGRWTVRPRSPLKRPEKYSVEEELLPIQKGFVGCDETFMETRSWVPEDLESLIPRYAESSVAMRELHHDYASDSEWRWCRDRFGTLLLEKKVSLGDEAARRFYRGAVQRRLYPQDVLSRQAIIVTSELPNFVPSWWDPRYDDAPDPRRKPFVDEPLAGMRRLLTFSEWAGDVPRNRATELVRRGLTLIGMLLASFTMVYAVRFIARRVFLIDLQVPLWLTSPKIDGPVGANVFFQRVSGPEVILDPAKFHVVRLAEIERKRSLAEVVQRRKARSWSAVLHEIDRAPLDHDVVIVDFEERLQDKQFNSRRLDFLETLVKMPGREVVVLSTVSPSYMLAAAAIDEAERVRWERLLYSFVWLTEAEFLAETPKRPTTPLEEEVGSDPFLKTFLEPLEPIRDDRERVYDEIRERADSHYARLWAGCDDDEKLMLYHLAVYGLLNGRNRRVARRLFARRLIRRLPQIRIFNETFRRYVIDAGRRDDIARLGREEEVPMWDRMRVRFAIVMVTALVLLVATQRELFTTTTAIITALAAALPALIQLVGVLSGTRPPASEAGR